ncbi:MAG TPA: alpha/beta fold hydrolase [Candidatus Angelobacter sp.]|nr:alpha/beta fold hydrolase [Candidatus Angelobacter sp.]
MPQSERLLIKIQESDFNLRAEDAFLVPAWFSQQHSWVREQHKSDSAIYNYPVPIRVRGPLDAEALERSVREILQRHEVLRSVFRIVDGELVQIIIQPEKLSIPWIDLGNFEPATRESQTHRLALADALQPFDLARGPLMRASLVRIAAEDHVLLLNTHHIVWDDWSTGIFLRELSLLYQAFTTGQSSPLPELSFQYADFVRWQEERFNGVELPNRISFWKETLRGGSDFHHLATDHPRPGRRSYHGSCEAVTLDEDLIISLKSLSRRERVSLFMTMLAAFQCLLHRYSGDTDIAVGSCAANRPLAEVEGVIGRFGNDLILRTDLSGNPTFRELLGRVRKTALMAYSYQDLPFGRLVEELHTSQDPSRSPLFQVMFILEDAPKEQMQIPGLTLSQFPLDLGTAKYDLNVWLRVNEGLEVALEYSTDLFEAATMRQILIDYQTILESMRTDLEGRISDARIAKKRMPAGILSSSEVHQEYATHNGANQHDAVQHDAIQSRLVEIWETVLRKRPIAVHDDFFELGGDSLRAARLFAQMNQSFGRSLSLGTLFQAPTIAALAKIISGAASTGTCLVTIQAGSTRPPLFCAHGQSGNVIMYRDLARYFGPDQPVYGLQPRGLVGKTPPLTRIEDMAATYVEEIQSVQPHGPYFLAGYCMGGTVALEMAQQLCKLGQTVGLVVLLDTYNWERTKRAFLPDLYFKMQTWWFGWRHFLLLPPNQKRTFLQRRWNELHQESSELSECNKRAALSYVPKVYVGRILHVSPLRQYARYKRPELAWDELCADTVEHFYLPIYPGQIFEEPFVRDLAGKLRASIDEMAEKWKFTPDLRNGASQSRLIVRAC